MDLATVLLLHKSSFFIGALCFLYVRWQSPRSHGLGVLAIAFLLLAIASTVAGLGEKRALPLYAWALSSFALGTFGYAVFWIGIRRLSSRKKRPFDWLATALPMLLTATAVITGFHLDNLFRGSVFQFNSILFLSASAVALVHDTRHEKLSARYALAASIVVAAILSLFIILGLVAWKAIHPRDAFFLLILCHFAIALFTLVFVKERAEATLTKLLDTDALTQIHNRRWFFSQLPAAPRAGDAFIIIDIDHFKRVNDTFGHAAGDAVLASVAQKMAENLRKSEIFARLGGEEFGIYLPAASDLEPRFVAEKLRNAIQFLDVRSGETDIPVTISAGIAIAGDGLQMNELMSVADIALYSAKNLGRNRVELHPSSPSSANVAAARHSMSLSRAKNTGRAA
ncbi:GGDEF domain-containing protein [Rhizobium herbae]|uniref:diguanylate cyclase n=1 Tax=Rhizobium herbae TaxID=508661 RepID=A0ABS4EK59_9HYPH|nr:GGDEF domain-containing protein [Rhizobium herbae]MBP1858337.1 diguanylate cyclase (GGDEF)-like protein [Rhizobium herbae]